MSTGWSFITRTKAGQPNPAYQETYTRAEYRCEAEPKIGLRCPKSAEEVVEWFPNPLDSFAVKRAAFCTECRQKCMGKSAAEVRLVKRRAEAQQMVAFDDGRAILSAWGVAATEKSPIELRTYTVRNARDLAQACGQPLAVFDRAIAAATDEGLAILVRKEIRRQMKMRGAA